MPPDWPGARLRAAYHDFAAELLRRREPLFAEAT
jgi:phenylacetic acid degradation operon negative regulatory protein